MCANHLRLKCTGRDVIMLVVSQEIPGDSLFFILAMACWISMSVGRKHRSWAIENCCRTSRMACLAVLTVSCLKEGSSFLRQIPLQLFWSCMSPLSLIEVVKFGDVPWVEVKVSVKPEGLNETQQEVVACRFASINYILKKGLSSHPEVLLCALRERNRSK